ncbi:MAG: hypothetical protein ABI615_08385 [Chthoniobacterales bacterium]
MNTLQEKNLQPIGLILKEVFNTETNATCLARYLLHTSSLPKKLQIPPLIVPDVYSEKVKLLIP